jgi:hypothetical protein
MGAKSQPISPPFWHKAGLPPSKKYLIVRQPLFDCKKFTALSSSQTPTQSVLSLFGILPER